MLSRDQLQAFEQNEYLLIDSLLNHDLLELMRYAFDCLDRYRNLLDLDDSFLQVVSHPVLYLAIASILDSPPQLLQFDGINRQSGQGD